MVGKREFNLGPGDFRPSLHYGEVRKIRASYGCESRIRLTVAASRTEMFSGAAQTPTRCERNESLHDLRDCPRDGCREQLFAC